MYSINQDILDAYASDSRQIYTRATFNDNRIIDGEYIKSFTITDSAGGNGSLTLGNACSAKLELDMYMPDSAGYTYTDVNTGETTTYDSFTGLAGAKIAIETGIEVNGIVEYTPLGVFFVDSFESKDEFKSVTITAFDAMLKIDTVLGSSYTCSLSAANPTVMAVLQDILTQAGISTSYIGSASSGDITHYINHTVTIPNPNTVDVSARTMLGYMAGIMGCNAKFDRNGHFILKRIGGNTDINIERTEQYMDGFETQAQNWLTVGYVTTGSDTNGEGQGEVVTVGNGTFGFNFENPYVPLTVNTTPTTVAQRILDLYNGLSFISGNVKYRYNPSIDCGDTILAAGKVDGDYLRLITLGHRISMTGGLSATVECNINTDTAKEFVSTPNSKKLTSKFNDFISKYQDIVKVLTSVSGGFVKEVRDSSEKIRALAITQSDIEVKWDETNNKVVVVHSYDNTVPMWVWSYGGLSFSNNGGRTYEVAINMQGEIYSNNLVSARGTIGAFTVDDASITLMGGLFADFIPKTPLGVPIDGEKAYRLFIQPAYDSYGQIPSETWIFSVQEADISNQTVGNYTSTFRVEASGNIFTIGNLTMNGNAQIGGTLKLWNDFLDGYGKRIFVRNNAYIFGIGAYETPIPTYLEGDRIYLRAKGSNYTYIQQDGNTRLTLGRASYTLNGNTADRDFIESAGGFVLEANGGNNWLYLYASKVYSTCDVKINGNLDCCDINCGAITATGTVEINYTASAACPVYMTKTGALYPYTSSRRYKENIKYELDGDLNPEKLYDLPIAQYNYKEEYTDRSLAEGKQIGIIAEDVAEIYPNAVIKNGEGEVESWQSMIMLPAMLKLIQEQKIQLDEQAAEIDDLKTRLSALEDVVTKLTKEASNE